MTLWCVFDLTQREDELSSLEKIAESPRPFDELFENLKGDILEGGEDLQSVIQRFETIEDNPFFQLHSYEYTNDPKRIAQHGRMLAINGAMTVDLSGQIGVYAVGPRVYSGTGGQLAFHLGAFPFKVHSIQGGRSGRPARLRRA